MKKLLQIFFVFMLPAVAFSTLHAEYTITVTEMTGAKKMFDSWMTASSDELELQGVGWRWKGVLSSRQTEIVKAQVLSKVRLPTVKKENKNTVSFLLNHTKVEVSAEPQTETSNIVSFKVDGSEPSLHLRTTIPQIAHTFKVDRWGDRRDQNPLRISIAKGADIILAPDKNSNKQTVKFIIVTVNESAQCASR